MSQQSTQGPWEVRQLPTDPSKVLIAPVDLNKAPVALGLTYHEGSLKARLEGEKNARLLAAAPALLGKLEECLEAFERINRNVGGYFDLAEEIGELIIDTKGLR